jgi:YggT family protein
VAGAFLLNFIRFLLIGIQLVILARVLLSWVDPQGRSPFAAFIIQTTEPILGPVRKLLPRTGMFDLSPIIVILVLTAILRAIN